MNSLLVFQLLVCVGAALATTNFCTAPLCKPGVTHVACNPLGQGMQINCTSGARQVDLTGQLQAALLDAHNRLRSQVATGNLDRFPASSHMTLVTWDPELAHVAGFNARQCLMKHDSCRATPAFPNSGQNLAQISNSNAYPNLAVTLPNMVQSWFNEHVHAPADIVANFRGTSGKQIGHFTQMIQQRGFRMGCAVVQWKSGWYQTLLTCNYSFINFVNQPIYTIGTTCSGCPSRCSTAYPGLCF